MSSFEYFYEPTKSSQTRICEINHLFGGVSRVSFSFSIFCYKYVQWKALYTAYNE